MSTTKVGLGLGLMVAAVVAVILLVGDDESGDSTASTDAMFISSMVPHHESAIEMAQIAQDRAENPEIKQLADDIVASQSSEIETMNEIGERLYGEPASEIDAPTMSMGEMGMSTDTAALEAAKPFDREFIDMMVPHHQGAIVMARMELADGEDAEAKALATDIVAAQSREIEQMNEWRTKWYGSPSPAGGVPDPGEAMMSGSGGSMGS